MTRPFQRTLASELLPLKERIRAPLDPVTVTRQRTIPLNRACTPALSPPSGLIRELVAWPP